MSKFVIYNSAYEPIGLLQNEISVIWLEKYQNYGEVKITAKTTTSNLDLLIVGNFISNSDTDTLAEFIHVETIENSGETTIEARAFLTVNMLSNRVVLTTEQVRNIESAMYSLYIRNKRDLPFLTAPLQGYPQTMESEITWNSVMEAMVTLANYSGLGFKVVFDGNTREQTFTVYQGKDRSNETKYDYVGYLSADTGNIYNTHVISGISGYKNIAFVAGEGEGSDRTVRQVDRRKSKEPRYELYVDARDLRKEYQVSTPTGNVDSNGNLIYTNETKTYTGAEYAKILETRGIEKLNDYMKDFSITCDILQNNIVYGVDYFLGDRMPLKLSSYGINTTARIAEVRIEYEKTGKTTIVTLDEFT